MKNQNKVTDGIDSLVFGKNFTVSMDTNVTNTNNNAIIIGGTGSGKTMSFTLPCLLNTNSGSRVVTLSKRKLLPPLRHYFMSKGYDVRDVNLMSPLESEHSFDPMKYVKSWEDIMFLANSIVYAEEKKKSSNADPFWDLCAISLLASIMAMALIQNLKATMSDVMELFKTLRIEDSDTYVKTSLDGLFDELQRLDPNHFAVFHWNVFACNPPKTAGNIYSTLAGILSKVFSEEVCAMIKNKPSIDIQSIANRKTIVFITSSPVNTTSHMFTNILYGQVFKELFEYSQTKNTGRLPNPVHIICDDFAVGCKIHNLDKLISIFRESGISVQFNLQSESQLQSIYGADAATTIINNCDTYIYTGGMDLDTAASVSKRCNKSLSDVLSMEIGKLYLFRRGSKPMLLERYPIYDDQRYINLQNSLQNCVENMNETDNIIMKRTPKRAEEESSISESSISIGQSVSHKKWGAGKIIGISQTGNMINVEFQIHKDGNDSVVVKRLSRSWLAKNCLIS